jgi:hypothetical protein
VPRPLELTRRPVQWKLWTAVQPSSPRVPKSLELTRRVATSAKITDDQVYGNLGPQSTRHRHACQDRLSSLAGIQWELGSAVQTSSPRVPRSLELTRRPVPWELGTAVQPPLPRVPRSFELTCRPLTRRLVPWELGTADQPTSPRVPRSLELTRRPVP